MGTSPNGVGTPGEGGSNPLRQLIEPFSRSPTSRAVVSAPATTARFYTETRLLVNQESSRRHPL